MRVRLALSLLGTCCLLYAGCLSRQVSTDGRNFRQSLQDMYTDQVMDNLISAANNQAFVQLDYKGLIVTDTQTIKANISDESDPTSARTLARKTGAILASMHGYTNKLLYGGSFDCNRQMQFSADPVAGKSDIYDYYIAFVREPSLFCSSEQKPRGAVHIAKKSGDRWYWVPTEAAALFLQLALKTTVMRGPDPAPPIYWETTIEDVAPQYNEKTGEELKQAIGGQMVTVKYFVTLASEVPNGDNGGVAEVTLADGSKQQFELHKLRFYNPIKGVADQTLKTVPDTVTATKIIYVTYDPTKSKRTIDEFKGRPCLIYSYDVPNLVAKSPAAQHLEDMLVNYRKSIKR